MDARALLRAKRYDAAYYMAGYAVECALKACVAKQTQRYDFPPKDAAALYTHDLEKLKKAAKISGFDQDREKDRTLAEHWEVVKDWKPEDWRYDLRGRAAITLAKNIPLAVDDKNHGVLQCLSKYW